MSAHDNSKRHSERMDLEAAEWLIKRDRGFSPREQDEFFAWLAGDPRRGERFAEHGRTWKRLDVLVQWRPEHSDSPSQDLLQSRPRRWNGFGWFGGIAAALVVSFAAWQYWSGESEDAVEIQSFAAENYERHRLADGTYVETNGGAAVKVEYSPGIRRVELVSSEAHFEVAKDPSRPFVVAARGVEVLAVGTAFNVRIGDDEVEVLVTEGEVRVGSELVSTANLQDNPFDEASESHLFSDLKAGQMSVVSTGPLTEKPQVTDADISAVKRIMSWRQSLDFDAVPLGEVVAAFNERHSVEIVVEDPKLRIAPIVASFRSDDLEQFVRLLEFSMGIEAVWEGERIYLRQSE